jgi:hypothetical protein
MGIWGGKLAVLGMLLACASATSAATSRDEVRKQVEASMLIRGTIDLDRRHGISAGSRRA